MKFRAKDAAKMMDKHGVHQWVVMANGHVRAILSAMDIVALYANG